MIFHFYDIRHMYLNDYNDRKYKFANRKRADMNKRLDKIYEDMDSVESERIECLNRLQAVQEQQLNEKKIYQMLLEFDRIYDNSLIILQANHSFSLSHSVPLAILSSGTFPSFSPNPTFTLIALLFFTRKQYNSLHMIPFVV